MIQRQIQKWQPKDDLQDSHFRLTTHLSTSGNRSSHGRVKPQTIESLCNDRGRRGGTWKAWTDTPL